MTTILGVKIKNRAADAQEVQRILTDYGCSIKTRLGLHIASKTECAKDGLVILEIIDNEDAEQIKTALVKFSDVEVQEMKF